MKEDRQDDASEDAVASRRARQPIGLERIPRDEADDPAEREQNQVQREEELIVARKPLVLRPEDVLDEHVARVGADSERESRTRDVAAEHEDGGQNAERRDHEK